MKPRLTALVFTNLLVLATLMFTGCASGDKFTSGPPPTPDKARIYVYRKAGAFGYAGYDKVYVNNTLLATMRLGGYATTDMPPGTVAFSLNPKMSSFPGDPLIAAIANQNKTQYEKLRIEVEAGKTYYVNLYVATTTHKMKVVDEATGAKEIRSLNLCKPGD